MSQATFSGLTSAEVAERIRLGQVNRSPRSDWADYAAIVSRNLLTLFNLMVVPAAVALFYLDEPQAGLAVSGFAIVNSALGLTQELRAKRHLDRLAILVETRARVVRDGQVHEIPASAVVLGDCIRLQSGDTVVADGIVLEAQFLEVDEALLTGESDPVRRQGGDRLLSGSACVAGEGAYRADKVGASAFAQSTSAEARRYHYTASPMTQVINVIIKVLTGAAVALCLLYLLFYLLGNFPTHPEDPKKALVLAIAATITSMVPQGLVLMATVSFTLGAVVMSSRGAMVQRLNAVEAMASIDVICTDKTGTLTTNRLHLARLKSLAPDIPDDEEVRRRLALFASASVDRQNRNILALRTALGEQKTEVMDQVPFKSEHRYSAVRIRDNQIERVLVLGAPEISAQWAVGSGQEKSGQWPGGSGQWQTEVEQWQRQGLRVLLFGEVPPDLVPKVSFSSLSSLPTAHCPPATAPARCPLPAIPLALVALSDELRPEADKVLLALTAQGIAFKVVSGDNPETVRATVSHLDLPLAREPVVTGQELEQAADRAELVRVRSVFGRVAPKQKVEIVEALRAQGCRVAMIGDGVNDVLPIKRADLGIAMGEGTQAAKTVSGLVLENNNFALLPETLEEGRTIVRNLRRSAKLFLVKNVYSLILILTFASGVLGTPFPYKPQQVTLLNWLVIGFPALVISVMRERSGAPARRPFLREVGWFAMRTGMVFGLAGVTILGLAKHVWAYGPRTQLTMLLSVLVLLGITALLRALDDGGEQAPRGDRRLRWLSGGAVPVYLLAMYWPLSANFFELTALNLLQWWQVLVVAAPAYGLTILSDRLWSQPLAT
jgi:cation-transporting ATPase E